MSKKWIRFMAALTLLALAAGCGGGTQQAPAQPQAAAQQPAATQPQPAKAPSAEDELIAEFGGQSLIDAAKKEGSVVVYTANILEQETPFVEAFQKRFGIKVELERRIGGQLHEKVVTEAEAKKLRADILEYSDVSLLLRVRNLLVEHTPPTDARYPEKTKKKGLMYPDTVYLYGPVYNSAVIPEKDAPKSWADLKDPKYKGKLALVIAGSGGTSWATVLFQRQTFGLDYWKALAEQKPKLFTGGSALVNTLASGENPVAVLHDVVAKGAIQQGAPVKIVYPPEGIVMIPQVMSVVKDAPHPNAARLWANWKLSREGQGVWVNTVGGFSARSDMPSPKDTPPRESIKIWNWNEDDYIKLRDQWINEWNQIYGYRPK